MIREAENFWLQTCYADSNQMSRNPTSIISDKDNTKPDGDVPVENGGLFAKSTCMNVAKVECSRF